MHRKGEAPDPRRLAETARQQIAEGRLFSLAAAVRDHEERTRHQLLAIRPHDEALYRRLRQIAGEFRAA